MKWFKAACILTLFLLAVACERLARDYPPANNIAGFYLLNEGAEGSNKCTLDYYDYDSPSAPLSVPRTPTPRATWPSSG